MTIANLIDQARAAGLRIHTDDGVKLTIRGPQEAGDLARALLDRKADVLAEMASNPGPDHWLVASRALGRPMATSAPDLHTCNAIVTDTISGKPIRLDRRGCVACQDVPPAADELPSPSTGEPVRRTAPAPPTQPCAAGVTACGATPARPYPCGWRCEQHAPEATR
ncbi:hypothetical protein [Micromonospora sp. NPDC048169]|uniref:hypothetical protein n=1 Tax=Micromonospora sp. NPDC048169 TaxID=3154711 RepID=UPI0033D0B1D4